MDEVMIPVEDLAEILVELENALKMMDPLYTMKGADKSGLAVVEKYKLFLPYYETILPSVRCLECDKRFIHDDPYDDKGTVAWERTVSRLIHHMIQKHDAEFSKVDLIVFKDQFKPVVNKWNTKADYINYKNYGKKEGG